MSSERSSRRAPFPPGLRRAVLAVVVLVSCGNPSLSPRPVPSGRALCARCGMTVSDASFAAEVVFASGETRYYDDIGCLATDGRIPEGKRQAWVRSEGGTRWTRAEEAFYARLAAPRTPMGYGFHAFATRAGALRSDPGRPVLSWEQVRRQAAADDESRGVPPLR